MIFTLWWCGRVLFIWCVFCVVVSQRVIVAVYLLFANVAACYRDCVCTVRLCGSIS